MSRSVEKVIRGKMIVNIVRITFSNAFLLSDLFSIYNHPITFCVWFKVNDTLIQKNFFSVNGVTLRCWKLLAKEIDKFLKFVSPGLPNGCVEKFVFHTVLGLVDRDFKHLFYHPFLLVTPTLYYG